jgi:hypothetical protein
MARTFFVGDCGSKWVFVRGVGFEPTTSLPGDGIEAFPRSDATTAPFPPPIRSYYNLFLVRDEFSRNRYYILNIRCRYNLFPSLFLEDQSIFSYNRKSDSDCNSKTYALKFKNYILKIIAFVSTSSNPDIRSPNKYKVSFISPDLISPARTISRAD